MRKLLARVMKPYLALVVLAVLALTAFVTVSAMGTTASAAGGNDQKFQWDLVDAKLVPPPGVTNPGGLASAKSQDGGRITLSGSGTFVVGEEDDVTGGGTWETFDPDGVSTGHRM